MYRIHHGQVKASILVTSILLRWKVLSSIFNLENKTNGRQLSARIVNCVQSPNNVCICSSISFQTNILTGFTSQTRRGPWPDCVMSSDLSPGAGRPVRAVRLGEEDVL